LVQVAGMQSATKDVKTINLESVVKGEVLQESSKRISIELCGKYFFVQDQSHHRQYTIANCMAHDVYESFCDAIE